MIRLLKNKKGFTLAEIVIAAVILATAVGGLWACFIASKRFSISSKTSLMAIHNARYVLEKLREDVRADEWDSGNLQVGGPYNVTTWLPNDSASFRNKYNGRAVYSVSNVSGTSCRRVDLTMTWDTD